MSIWNDIVTTYKEYEAPEWNLKGRWGRVSWGKDNKGHNRIAVQGQLNVSTGAATEEDADRIWAEKIAFLEGIYAEKLTKKDHPTTVIVDGNWYTIGEKNNDPKAWKGFGGRKWTIKFHDERVVETDNLWHGGDIPSGMKEKLPDNAVFVR